MITTVLFDLDGTLLPMDQEIFVKDYFGRLARFMAPHGYDPQALVETVWKGTFAMVSNDGACTNEEAFWRVFTARFGEAARQDEPLLEAFDQQEFPAVRQVCGHNPAAAALVARLRQQGVTVALATNPIFPAVATRQRIRWAGLREEDFQLVTTYENSRHCKPNPAYYQDVAAALGVDPHECLMVGNDVGDDLPAAQLGMDVFILTDCLINKDNVDLSPLPHGGFAQLEKKLGL